MASTTTVVLIDDIDGSPAKGTVAFALDGIRYEIDLSAVNATALRDGLAPFIKAARRVSATKTPRKSTQVRSRTRTAAVSVQVEPVSPATYRTWANENGYEIGNRGRISAAIRAAYAEAFAIPSRPKRARKVSAKQRTERKVTVLPPSRATLVAWANVNGFSIKSGRVPAAVLEAYNAAQSTVQSASAG